MQPLLDEASLLESQREDVRYADANIGYAIKPDKRSFPKRSYMTLIGAALSFFFGCFMAFFSDIWKEVTRPEEKVYSYLKS